MSTVLDFERLLNYDRKTDFAIVEFNLFSKHSCLLLKQIFYKLSRN